MRSPDSRSCGRWKCVPAHLWPPRAVPWGSGTAVISSRLTRRVVKWYIRNLAKAICTMWTITPDYLEQVKEELKGRHAAIQARIAHELKSLDAEIEEVEAIERLALNFAAKHQPAGEAATGK